MSLDVAVDGDHELANAGEGTATDGAVGELTEPDLTAGTMPWPRLRRPQVLKIRGLLEEHYQPATANRMLAALRGVLRECWQARLITIEEYQAATSIPAVRGEPEPRGRHLSAGELGSLFRACSPSSDGRRQDSPARRRRDAAFLALAYSCGLRRSEVVAIDLADLDLVNGELRVRWGKGRKPRLLTMPPSVLPALQDWIQVRGSEAGPLFCPVLKSGRLLREAGQLARLSPAAVWRICRERWLQAQIPAPVAHDLRRTWIGDLLDLGVDLATVQKMAGHASAATTGRYDRRDRRVQRRAATLPCAIRVRRGVRPLSVRPGAALVQIAAEIRCCPAREPLDERPLPSLAANPGRAVIRLGRIAGYL